MNTRTRNPSRLPATALRLRVGSITLTPAAPVPSKVPASSEEATRIIRQPRPLPTPKAQAVVAAGVVHRSAQNANTRAPRSRPLEWSVSSRTDRDGRRSLIIASNATAAARQAKYADTGCGAGGQFRSRLQVRFSREQVSAFEPAVRVNGAAAGRPDKRARLFFADAGQ